MYRTRVFQRSGAYEYSDHRKNRLQCIIFFPERRKIYRNRRRQLFLADYASIKNGSYGKLMKAYYGKNKTALSDAASATKKTNSKTATADTTSENASLQKSANALVKSAESLLKTGKDSVFKEKDITTKDENGVEKTTKGYDTDAIYKAVSAFADDYNSVLSAAAKSKNSSVVSTASNMVQQTVANEKCFPGSVSRSERIISFL